MRARSLELTTPSDREIRVTRVFDARRERVFHALTDPELLTKWWGRGNELVVERFEPARGGHFRFVEHAADGVHGFEGRFRELVERERIVHTFEWDGMPGFVAVSTTELRDEADGATRLTTTSLFLTQEERDVMLASGMEKALEESYRALDTVLAAHGGSPRIRDEDEIRAVFATWFRCSSERDLECLMSRVAEDAVSYEHEAPLRYVGREAIRRVCRRGLATAAAGDIMRWDIPDLAVIVRGDVAVTWGLDRVVTEHGDGSRSIAWSRGTRVFQRILGRWQMIHQHVSLPCDPETGKVRADLEPK